MEETYRGVSKMNIKVPSEKGIRIKKLTFENFINELESTNEVVIGSVPKKHFEFLEKLQEKKYEIEEEMKKLLHEFAELRDLRNKYWDILDKTIKKRLKNNEIRSYIYNHDLSYFIDNNKILVVKQKNEEKEEKLDSSKTDRMYM